LEDLAHATVIKRGGGMVQGDDRNRPVGRLGLEDLAVDLADRLELEIEAEFPHDVIHAMPAERGDDFRLDDLDLPVEEWPVECDLIRRRVAVLMRSVFDDVRYVDFFARQADRPEEEREELPRRAAERLAGLGLGLAGRLADEHDRSVVAALADDRKIFVARPISKKRRLLEGKELVAYPFHLVEFGHMGIVLQKNERIRKKKKPRKVPGLYVSTTWNVAETVALYPNPMSVG